LNGGWFGSVLKGHAFASREKLKCVEVLYQGMTLVVPQMAQK